MSYDASRALLRMPPMRPCTPVIRSLAFSIAHQNEYQESSPVSFWLTILSPAVHSMQANCGVRPWLFSTPLLYLLNKPRSTIKPAPSMIFIRFMKQAIAACTVARHVAEATFWKLTKEEAYQDLIPRSPFWDLRLGG
jgi:hypothetical protein